MALLKLSTAYTRAFKMVSSTDHFSLKTGAAPVVNLSKAGAAFGAAAGAVSEITSGWYKVALSTVDTGTLGDLAYYITGTGADDTDFCDQVGPVDANTTQFNGSTILLYSGIGGEPILPVMPTGDYYEYADFTSATASTFVGTLPFSMVTNQCVGRQGYVWHTAAAGEHGQIRTITAFNAGTGTFTITPNWTTTPTSGARLHLLADSGSNLTAIAGTAVSTPATAGILDVNVKNIDNDAASASGTVTFPNATLASTTNITAGTITTTTNLTTNNDKTGYGLSAAAVQAVWDALTSALTTVGSIGKLLVDNLNATISSRMATYTQPTGFLAATFPTGTVANTTNITAGTITTATNVTTVNGLAAGVISATSIAADAITAAKIADGAIDRATFAADTGIQSIRSNTAQAGAAGTITFDAGASATDNFYNGLIVYLTGATGAGQARVITAYVGATKIATIAPNWTTNPDVTSTFALLSFANPTGIQGNVTGSVASVTGAVGSVTGNVGGNVVGSVASVTARVIANADQWAGGTIPAPNVTGVPLTDLKYTLGTISPATAGSVRTDAVTGAVGSVTGAVGSVTGAVGSVTGNVGGNVVGSVASVTAGITVTTNNDKTGYGLSAAAVQAIWDALTTALTTAGSIGKKLADWVIGTSQTGDSFARLGAPAGASVSADVAAVKTDTAAIKAKTDNLPTDPADESLIIAATDAIKADTAAVKIQTDKLAFTVTNQVDANIQSVNDVAVTGDGQSGTEWGP